MVVIDPDLSTNNTLNFVEHKDISISCTEPYRKNQSKCTTCNDFHAFGPHTRSTCPSRDKCVICTVVRKIDPGIVNHRTEDHIFKRKRPPRLRTRNLEHPTDEFSKSYSDGRGRPLVNRGCVPCPPLHENPNRPPNDLAYENPVQSSCTRRNRPTLNAKSSNQPPRRIYTAAI